MQLELGQKIRELRRRDGRSACRSPRRDVPGGFTVGGKRRVSRYGNDSRYCELLSRLHR